MCACIGVRLGVFLYAYVCMQACVCACDVCMYVCVRVEIIWYDTPLPTMPCPASFPFSCAGSLTPEPEPEAVSCLNLQLYHAQAVSRLNLQLKEALGVGANAGQAARQVGMLVD